MPPISITLKEAGLSPVRLLDNDHVSQGEVSNPDFKADDEFCTALSPRGERAAVISSHGRLFGVDGLESRWQKDLGDRGRSGLSPAYSPDARRLTLSDEKDHVVLLNASNGEILWKKQLTYVVPGFQIERKETLRSSPAFSPDGKRIAVGTESGKIEILNAATGDLIKQLDGKMEHATSAPVFSPDGKKIASTFWSAADSKHHLLLFDLSSGEKLWEKTTHYGWPIPLTFSPDGLQILAGSGCGTDEGTITLHNASDGSVAWEQKLSRRIASPPLFSPNGKKIYIPLWDRKLHMAVLDAEHGSALVENHAEGECHWQPTQPVLAGSKVMVAAMTGSKEEENLRLALYEFPAYEAARYGSGEKMEIQARSGKVLGGVAV